MLKILKFEFYFHPSACLFILYSSAAVLSSEFIISISVQTDRTSLAPATVFDL
jgi:hypothetical protein